MRLSSCWLGTLLTSGRVGFTISLISFIAYSSQIFVIWPWYGSALSIDLLKLLVPFKCVCPSSFLPRISARCGRADRLTQGSLLVFMIFWNYRLCVKTAPGAVPQGWVSETQAIGVSTAYRVAAEHVCTGEHGSEGQLGWTAVLQDVRALQAA